MKAFGRFGIVKIVLNCTEGGIDLKKNVSVRISFFVSLTKYKIANNVSLSECFIFVVFFLTGGAHILAISNCRLYEYLNSKTRKEIRI